MGHITPVRDVFSALRRRNALIIVVIAFGLPAVV